MLLEIWSILWLWHNEETDEDDLIGFDESLAPSLFVFKTIADPFVGRISLFKVCTGSIHAGMTFIQCSEKRS